MEDDEEAKAYASVVLEVNTAEKISSSKAAAEKEFCPHTMLFN